MDGSNDVPCIQIYSNIFKHIQMWQNVAECCILQELMQLMHSES